MLRNEVCECRASGVFLRLSAQGLIAENNIHSNGEAGLDIRKGANPTIVVIAASLKIMHTQSPLTTWRCPFRLISDLMYAHFQM